jgi:Domain of unknown function (DUF6268)
MNVLLCFIVLLTIVAFPFRLMAQDSSPLSVIASISPCVKNSASAKINLGYPVLNREKNIILTGLTFGGYNNTILTDSLDIQNYGYIGVPFSLIHRISSKYRLRASIEAGYSSDMYTFNKNTMRYSSTLAFMKTRGDTITLSTIILVTSQKCGLSINPMLYANIKLSDHLFFNGILPYKPKITWKFNADNECGIGIVTNRNTLYVGKTANDKYIEETQADAELFYNHRLIKKVRFFGTLGYTFLHSLRMYDSHERVPIKMYMLSTSKKESIPIDPKGIIFKVGVYYSLSD